MRHDPGPLANRWPVLQQDVQRVAALARAIDHRAAVDKAAQAGRLSTSRLARQLLADAPADQAAVTATSGFVEGLRRLARQADRRCGPPGARLGAA